MSFWGGLKDRELSGVKYIVSGDNLGLKKPLKKLSPVLCGSGKGSL